MSKLVTLEDWAKATYGERPPGIATLRRWARDARIYPAAVKHGRTYFVQPDAEYVDAARLRYGPKKLQAAQLARPALRT